MRAAALSLANIAELDEATGMASADVQSTSIIACRRSHRA